MNKTLRVSIVIPVYNEASYLPACLDAIARQSIKPYEVIVVDNNSTDESALIAARYHFVKLIRQPKQGVVYARDKGFDAVRGDIIGRIDADTIIADNWVETVADTFDTSDVDLITGSASYHDVALPRILNRIDLSVRRYMVWTLGKDMALQGANMAFRHIVWRTINAEVCRSGGIHEDFDIGIHAQRHGYGASFIEHMHVSIGARQLGSTLRQYVNYVMTSPRTYARHGVVRGMHMYPVILLALAGYVPLKILYNKVNLTNNKYSLSAIFSNSSTSRVNLATLYNTQD